MTRNDDFIGHLEGYLEDYEGSTPLPDDVRDAIRAQLPLTQQRPAWWPARRLPIMNNTFRIALAAAAVVVIAFLGFQFVAPDNTGPPGPTSTASETPAANATSTSVPANSPAGDSPTVRGWPGVTVNPPGVYSWQPGARGWMHNVDGDDAGLTMTFSTISASPDALESAPTGVTVAGYEATHQVVGLRQVWRANIDDTIFTITLTSLPTTSAAKLAEAEAIVDSIRREPMEDGSLKLTFTLPAGWDSG